MAAGTMAAIAAVQVGAGIAGGLSAQKAAEKAAERQAKLVAMQRAEERRQTRMQFAIELGGANLAAFASNLQRTGSTMGYLNMLESEQIRQLNYMYNANLAEQSAIRAGAAGAGTGALIQGVTAGLSTAISAYGTWRAGQVPPPGPGPSILASAPAARDFYADAGIARPGG